MNMLFEEVMGVLPDSASMGKQSYDQMKAEPLCSICGSNLVANPGGWLCSNKKCNDCVPNSHKLVCDDEFVPQKPGSLMGI